MILAAPCLGAQNIAPNKQLIHKQLSTTCANWKLWYKRDKTERARVNMNGACKKASDYSSNELNKPTKKPVYVAYNPNPKTQNKTRKKTSKSNNNGCEKWRSQLDKTQRKLRNGYKEPAGNTLRLNRRNLSKLIFENC
jgi:hypothetical protein